MIRIIHYRSGCIGCNACVEADETRWKISRKDGKSVLLGGKRKKEVFIAIAGEEEYDACMKAALNCPARIIKMERI